MLPASIHCIERFEFLTDTNQGYYLLFATSEMLSRRGGRAPLWHMECADRRSLDAALRWVEIRRDQWPAWGAMVTTLGLGLQLGRLRWWFIGLFGFAILCGATFALTALIDPAAVASRTELREAIGHLGGVPNIGSPDARGLAALALTVLVAPFLNLPLYLGEELGWRGFLTPRLVALMGRPGVLVAGAIWALWHLPLILLGYNYGAQPLVGMLVWIPLCMAFSVLLTALRNRGGAIWPAALAHGALNQLATLLTGTVLVTARFTPLIDGAAGLAGLLVFGTAASVVYLRQTATLAAALAAKPEDARSRLAAA